MSAPASASVRSVRALAYDGDAEFVVERAPDPPARAAALFRSAAEPIAARLAEQVRVARDLMAGGALDGGVRAAVGHGLQHTLAELRVLAESYDVGPVADVCRAREAGAARLDPRTVAGIEHVAHALLGATPADPVDPASTPVAPIAAVPVEAGPPAADPPPMIAPATVSPDPTPPSGVAAAHDASQEADGADDAAPPPFRPPTGSALVELLEHGISGLERWPGTPLDMPAVPAPPSTAVADGASAAPLPPDALPTPVDGIASVDTLLYRGSAALARARAVRDEIRAAGGPPDPDLLAELFDLLDLAAD